MTQTSLRVPQDMIQWATRAKILEPEPEAPAQAESSGRSRRRGSRSSIKEPAGETSRSQTTSATGRLSSSKSSRETSPALKKAVKLQNTLEAIKQDPNFESDFVNIDTAVGCCCYTDDGEELRVQVGAETTVSESKEEKDGEGTSVASGSPTSTEKKTVKIGLHVIPEDGQPSAAAAGSRRPSVGRGLAGNAGYHRRIWKRERGVGGKETTISTCEASIEASPALQSTESPASTPTSASLQITPRTQSPAVTTAAAESSTKCKDKEKGKGKVKEGLWSKLIRKNLLKRVIGGKAKESGNVAKMKGKASAAISPKDKGKGKMLVSGIAEESPCPSVQSSPSTSAVSLKESERSGIQSQLCPETPPAETIAGCDSTGISPPQATTTQPASSLEVLRWETQLLHQQHSDLYHAQCNLEDSPLHKPHPQNPQSSPHPPAPPPIPWPYKEFHRTTRDGRTSSRGFCSWCGGSLTYSTSVSLHGMIEVQAGSMDDPEGAMRRVGFLREFHCKKALGADVGGRLGTSVGHERDERVERVGGCDERRLFVDSGDDGEGSVDFEGVHEED
ncbi:hypothetical protein ABW19_dt0203783 [Dactylella cylindrospora]|nr:hypothetical protein ABW19_dt0203783 [Dactylella cylindrospora]